MKLVRRMGTTMFAGSTLAALVLGGLALTSSPAHAGRRPGPLCGPTYLWICSGNGQEGVLFGGTICEKNQFEQQTGMHCVPYAGG